MSDATWSPTRALTRVTTKSTDPSVPTVSIPVISGLLIAADAILVLASSYASYLLWLDDEFFVNWSGYALVSVLAALLSVNVFHFAGLYSFDALSRFGTAARRLIGSWTLVAVGLIALSFATKTSAEYSRGWSALWFVLVLVSTLSVRLLLYRQVRRWVEAGMLSRRVAIIGTGEPVRRLLQNIATKARGQVQVAGIYSDREHSRTERDGEATDDLDRLVRAARERPIDTVIIATPLSDEEHLPQIVARLRELPIDVLLCPVAPWVPVERPQFCELGNLPMLTVLRRPFAGWRYVVKELEDRILAAALLVLIAPVMAVIAVMIKLDSAGPVLFRQKRYGFNNQLIEVFKFRTMYHNKRDDNADRLVCRDDPRVTKLGAVLRRWSLDELPQFLNVLRGEMSIVGPRPHALSAKAAGRLYQDVVHQYAARHRVKPGITGWAQINGWRGETSTVEQIRKRVEYDLAYIDNWSLPFDLQIIALTVVRGFRDRNAF